MSRILRRSFFVFFLQNDLTDLYGSLNLSGVEQDENNLEAIMRINSFLNNSLDLRNLSSENAHKNSIGLYLFITLKVLLLIHIECTYHYLKV